jgi:hypothetical protein
MVVSIPVIPIEVTSTAKGVLLGSQVDLRDPRKGKLIHSIYRYYTVLHEITWYYMKLHGSTGEKKTRSLMFICAMNPS